MTVPLDNRYLPLWEELEAGGPQPTRLRHVHHVAFDEFERRIRAQDAGFVKDVVTSLYAGDVYLIGAAFPKAFMVDLRQRVHAYWSLRPESFHKMLEGCPDFHRVIDEELAKKYSFKMVKHSAYFYPWNDDPLGLFPVVMPRWRPFKFLGGVDWYAYEKNTPKDGVIDRIQVVRYLPKVGTLETHSDPFKHQRMFISGYMSKRGVDFQEGGFYAIGAGDTRVYLEDEIDVGDMGIGYATLLHG
ncbi:MAG: hypothetical protein HY047_20360, partial [Acidobacteria bacterium]|nr:hypothetical protein [Acidobacteriota bacterium]